MFKITAALREYFNYRYDDPSFRVECAKLHGAHVPAQRDFRTPKERREANAAFVDGIPEAIRSSKAAE